MKRYQILKGILMISCLLNYGFNFAYQNKQTNNQNSKNNFKILTTEDGLSNNTVSAFLQDQKGFIWIGTKDGLNKYDGYEFIVYRNNPNDSTSITNNEIWDLAEDSKGNIWIATYGGGVCKFDPKTEEFKSYVQKPQDSSKISYNHVYDIFVDSKDRVWSGNWIGMDLYNPKKDIFEPILSSPKEAEYINGVYCIVEDQQHNIWIGTDESGLKCYNPTSKEFIKNYRSDADDPNSLIDDYVSSILIDKKGEIWLQHEMPGVTYINPKTNQVAHYFEEDEDEEYVDFIIPNFIHQDASGRILMGSADDGVKWFDPENMDTNAAANYLIKHKKSQKYGANAILEDNTGSFWVGTVSQGIIYVGSNHKPFNYRASIANPYPLFSNQPVYKIFEDSTGFLWLGGKGFGLSRMNPKNGSITHANVLLASLDIDTSNIEVTDIIEDQKGFIWVSTSENGFIRINPKTMESESNYFSLDNNDDVKIIRFNSIMETKDGILWLGNGAGVLASYDPHTRVKRVFLNGNIRENEEYLPGYYVNVIYEDLDDNLLIGFADEGLHILDKNTGNFTPVNYRKKKLFDPGTANITSIHQSKKEILWIGTASGLLKKNLKTQQVTQYTTNNGLPNNYVSNILEDEKGNLWLSTNHGISKFEPTKEVFKNYTANDGLLQTEYNIGSAHRSSKNGSMYFGGKKGYNFFHPKNIKDNDNVPSIVITKLMKKGKSENFVQVPGINFKKELKLPYTERDFLIEFAALDYTNPEANKYAYFLEGYNKNWIELETRSQVTFTNLNPGSYYLRLKGSNNDGIWNEMHTSIKIIILPPWWLSWWAYCLYLTLILILLYGFHTYRIKKDEASKLKELHEVKSRLFTNISHELRTPLTLISGPIEQILKENIDMLDLATKNRLLVVRENTNSLRTLIDDILDLSKLEANKLELNQQSIRLDTFIKGITQKFIPLAEQNSIRFKCSFENLEEHKVAIDSSKLEKIINNLLSNAFKYTPPKGSIDLIASEKNNHLYLDVQDSGRGMSKKDLPRIFDRYFQSIEPTKPLVGGSGIGLSLVKELVNLMKGEITVKSQVGHGSTFKLLIPLTKAKDIDVEPIENQEEDIITEKISLDHLLLTNENQKKEYTIMIVEDHIGMQNFIGSILEKKYKLIVVSNGEEALQKLAITPVDLIISDIMMPVMDGYSLLETVKRCDIPMYNDVPFVILTALKGIDQKLKALTIGVDDYLTKPFSAEELLARTYNLISRYQQRKKEKQEIVINSSENDNIIIENITEVITSSNSVGPQNTINIQLIEQAAQIIEVNLENPEFKLSDLTKELHLGERQLRRKIKMVTGLTPKKFQQEIILQKARKLLENQAYENIKAVSLSVGMTHVTRFNRLYEARFGKHPSTYFRLDNIDY